MRIIANQVLIIANTELRSVSDDFVVEFFVFLEAVGS